MNPFGYAFQNNSDEVGFLSSTEHARYGFRINHLSFLYSTAISSEVIKETKTCRIPNSKKWFNGMVNVRGKLVPAFDLNHLFFNKPSTSSLFLILDKGSKAVALRINQFPELINDIEPSHKENTELEGLYIPEIIAPSISNYYVSQSEAWLEIDKEDFFSTLTSQISISS